MRNCLLDVLPRLFLYAPLFYPGLDRTEQNHSFLVLLCGLAKPALLDQSVAQVMKRGDGLQLLILLHHPRLTLVRKRVAHLRKTDNWSVLVSPG